jgi:hypothetical protein
MECCALLPDNGCGSRESKCQLQVAKWCRDQHCRRVNYIQLQPCLARSLQLLNALRMRPGDWFCADNNCQELNYKVRRNCIRCGTPGDSSGLHQSVVLGGVLRRHGDWSCGCGYHNFHIRVTCRRCGEPKKPNSREVALRTNAREVKLRDGDWRCSCGEVVFARRRCCRRCGTVAPPSTDAARHNASSTFEGSTFNFTDMSEAIASAPHFSISSHSEDDPWNRDRCASGSDDDDPWNRDRSEK